jgi:hypothetical protein
MRPYLPRYRHTYHLPLPDSTYSNTPGPTLPVWPFIAVSNSGRHGLGVPGHRSLPAVEAGSQSRASRFLTAAGGDSPFVISWMHTGSALPTLNLTGN